MLETKAGPKTTEFWVIIFANLAGVLQLSGVDLADVSNSQNKYVVIALAAVNGLYAVGRGLAKQGIPAVDPSKPSLRDPYLDDPGPAVLAPEDQPTGHDKPAITRLAMGASSGFTGTSTSSAGGTPVVAHTRRSTDPKPVKPAPKPAAKKPAPKAAPKPKGKGTA